MPELLAILPYREVVQFCRAVSTGSRSGDLELQGGIETAWTWITIGGTTDDLELQGGGRAIDIQHSVVCDRLIATGFRRDEGRALAFCSLRSPHRNRI